MYGHLQARYNQPPPQPYQQYPSQPPMNAFPHPNYQAGAQGQLMHPPKMNNNQQRSSIKGNNYQFPGPNAALMQPPALNFEQPMDTNSQFFHQRGPMTMSNNQHSEFDTNHQMEEDPMHQAQIASMFWQQRCMTMLDRFQWFYQRFQILRNQHLSLNEEMQKMDSEEEWHVFQQHHEEFHEKIQEMEQELSAVLGENQQLLLQKKSQDSQGVWEQRYQQLLGNFKSLQEEMTQLQANGGRGGPTSEQYRQLEQHCAELQYQYEQALNQLKMHRQGGDIEQQMNAYIEQLQAYKDKVNNLHSQNVELQQMLGQFQHQNEQLKQDRYKTNVDRNKFEQLMKQVEQKQEQIHSLQEQFKNRSMPKSAISQYEQSLQEKNRQIEDLRRTLNEKDNQINLNLTRTKEQEDNLNRQIKMHQKTNKQYEQQISNLKAQLQKQNQNGVKLQNLQRKLSYSNQQVSSLNETLKKKNQELIQLRGIGFEAQKLKQVQATLLQAADEKDRLAELIKKKGVEIEKLHIEIQKLNTIISENNTKRQEYSTRNLRSQIDDLVNQVRKNQAELNKARNVISMKDQYVSKLQEQIRRERQKLIVVQQILQTEREGWHQQQLRIASKGNSHSDRIRELDHEFNVQLKDTLERQVSTLRKQNAEKQQAIRGLQEMALLLQSQLSVYLKQEDNHNRDLSFLSQKEAQLQSIITNLNRRNKDLQATIKHKEEHILQSQRSAKETLSYSQSLQQKIQQHQKLIRLNSNTIKELQQQLKLSISREAQIDKVLVENAHLRTAIQSLQRERADQQQRVLNKSKVLSVNNSKKVLNDQNTIGQLLSQNQFLKEQIAKLLTHHSNHQYHNNSFQLNKRLNEFNNKLHMAISNPNPSHLSRSESSNTVVQWQKERNQLINHYQQQIETLKQKLQNKLSDSQASGLGNAKQLFFNGLQSKQLKEQNAFLKQKSAEQEQRNKHLIALNQELKAKISSILNIQQNTTLHYYKTEFQKAENEKQALKQRFSKVVEQNREFKLELASKNTKLTQDYEFRIVQLQLKIQQQQRKMSLLQGQRAAANIKKASYQHDENIKNLAHNIQRRKEEGTTPKSNISYKSGIQQELGSIMGNYRIGSSQARGSRFKLHNDANL